jgi:hypothetical protein
MVSLVDWVADDLLTQVEAGRCHLVGLKEIVNQRLKQKQKINPGARTN